MDLQLTAKSRDRRAREFMPKMGAAVDASTAGHDIIAVRRDGHASLRMRQLDPTRRMAPICRRNRPG
jgi:hypothetical protein